MNHHIEITKEMVDTSTPVTYSEVSKMFDKYSGINEDPKTEISNVIFTGRYEGTVDNSEILGGFKKAFEQFSESEELENKQIFVRVFPEITDFDEWGIEMKSLRARIVYV